MVVFFLTVGHYWCMYSLSTPHKHYCVYVQISLTRLTVVDQEIAQNIVEVIV